MPRQTNNADGVLGVIHDETVDRTTFGSGRVSELTWDKLATLHLWAFDSSPLPKAIGHAAHTLIATLAMRC